MNNSQPLEICILLDNQSNHSDSISSAAALARESKSQLQGFFLEDDALLNAADIPFTQEISLWSAQERPMTSGGLQRTMRAYARNIQKQLEKIAVQEQIQWSFQTIRGNRMQWISESGVTSDVLIISGDSKPQAYRRGRTNHRKSQAPLLVVFALTEASARALKTAIQIANETERPLAILVIDGKPELEAEMRVCIASIFEQFPPTTATSIAALPADMMKTELQAIPSHMLILPTDIEWVQQPEELKRLLAQTHSPIIFVR